MAALSLWWDLLPEDLAAPLGSPLQGDVEADVAIVGAGFTGLWTAYFLQRHDPSLRIRIIEAEVAGFGASGRNGGWASALFPVSIDRLAAKAGRDAAVRMIRTMERAVDDIGRIAHDEEWSISWAKGGTVASARSDAQLVRARDEVAHARSWGFGAHDLALLDRDDAVKRLAATETLGATFTPHCAAIDPARLVRSLARTVVQRGAVLNEYTRATEMRTGRVQTEHGIVRAPVVLRATEGYTRSLAGQRREIAPVYSLMLATAPLPTSTWDEIGLAQRETFYDGRHLIIYGQRTVDGRIAFGGRGAPYHFRSRITPEQDVDRAVHAGLRQALVELFPVLSGVDITHEWGGPLGIARDWWASVGFDRDSGLGWSGGYVGDGVTTSHLGGRTLADLVLNRATDRTTLPWVDHRSRRWEPEPLRWLGINAGLKAMSTADASEARTGRPSRIASAVETVLGR